MLFVYFSLKYSSSNSSSRFRAVCFACFKLVHFLASKVSWHFVYLVVHGFLQLLKSISDVIMFTVCFLLMFVSSGFYQASYGLSKVLCHIVACHSLYKFGLLILASALFIKKNKGCFCIKVLFYFRFLKIFMLSISVTYSNPASISFVASSIVLAVLLVYSSGIFTNIACSMLI